MYRITFLLLFLLLLHPFLTIAQGPIILLPPANYGAYHWGPDYQHWPGYPDRLNWGAGFVKRLGLKTIRVEMGFDLDGSYGFDPAPQPHQNNYLLTLAGLPTYAQLFSDPQLTTYLLTTYTPQAFHRLWGTVGADLEVERMEYLQLATYLGALYPTKQFILLNWEGDNDLSPYPARAAQYQQMLAMRVLGIRQAGMPSVKSGIEINCVYEDHGGPCGPARILSMISALEPDYISYSSWLTLNQLVYETNPAVLEQRLGADVDHIVSIAGPRYWAGVVIIGEFGRYSFALMPPDQFFRAVDLMARKRQMPFLIYWQTVDEPPERSLGLGAFDSLGNLTPNGWALYLISRPFSIPGWPPKGKKG